MRPALQVAKPRSLRLQPDTVAIAPPRTGQTRDLARNRDMRPVQSLLENVELHLQLESRTGVLILAATAAGKVLASRRHAFRGRLENGVQFAGSETAPVRGYRGFHQFAGQCSRNKNRLTCRNTCQ